jgi:hypothetical protein
LIFSFFCTCAELVEVSRQKDKEIRVRFLSDNSDIENKLIRLIQPTILYVFSSFS